MTNAQRRRASRNRRPAKPYFTPEAYELELSLRQVEATRAALLEDERRVVNRTRPIPTSGPGRRRAKARQRIRAGTWSVYALNHVWVQVDPNVRVHGNQTWVEADEDGALEPGDRLVAYENESGLSWPAVVTSVDDDRAYLDVVWTDVNPATETLYEGANHALTNTLRKMLSAAIDAIDAVVAVNARNRRKLT